MINVQETDGSWPALEQFEIYYTSYAVWALEGTEYQENVQKATKYLSSKISETGKCIDLGGTLMCAIAFWSANKYDADKSISFMEYILAFKAIEATNQLENQILTLTAACKLKDDQIKRFKEKYKDTDLVISKRATLIITIASIIVTFIGIIAGVIALV
jgi:ABC-type multidrug transport system permease subunit